MDGMDMDMDGEDLAADGDAVLEAALVGVRVTLREDGVRHPLTRRARGGRGLYRMRAVLAGGGRLRVEGVFDGSVRAALWLLRGWPQAARVDVVRTAQLTPLRPSTARGWRDQRGAWVWERRT